MPKLRKLKPFINEKIWGGEKLKALKNISSTLPVGETWEVSSLSSGKSILLDSGEPIDQDLSYIVKFIDTSDNLSVQVHPDDEYAKEHENENGKTECWIILSAEENAGIYLGFKKGVTRKEFINAATNKMSCNQFLNFIPVKAGDFFVLPPGTVHAIGKGITLCEVQQSSGVTYRVWDWNRKDFNGQERELHLNKASDVLQFGEAFNQKILSSIKNNVFEFEGIQTLIKHRDFKVELFNKFKNSQLELKVNHGDSIILFDGAIDDLVSWDSALVEGDGSLLLENHQVSTFLLVSGKN